MEYICISYSLEEIYNVFCNSDRGSSAMSEPSLCSVCKRPSRTDLFFFLLLLNSFSAASSDSSCLKSKCSWSCWSTLLKMMSNCSLSNRIYSFPQLLNKHEQLESKVGTDYSINISIQRVLDTDKYFWNIHFSNKRINSLVELVNQWIRVSLRTENYQFNSPISRCRCKQWCGLVFDVYGRSYSEMSKDERWIITLNCSQ